MARQAPQRGDDASWYAGSPTVALQTPGSDFPPSCSRRSRGFRETALGGRLLQAAQIEPWIQQQARDDGPATHWVRVPLSRGNRLTADATGFSITPALSISGSERPIGFALESLDYGVPDDNWTRCIPVALGGTLGQLRLLSEELADSYGWQKAQAVLFVLTDATPIVEVLGVGAMGTHRPRCRGWYSGSILLSPRAN